MAGGVEIAKYMIGIGGSPVGQNTHPSWLNMFDSANKRYLIRFHHSEKELPPDGNDGQLYVVNMPLVVLSNVVDILRNEKPVYLKVGDDKRAYLTTDQEDVGANE